MASTQMASEEWLQIQEVDVNTTNKQFQTAKNRLSCSLWIGQKLLSLSVKTNKQQNVKLWLSGIIRIIQHFGKKCSFHIRSEDGNCNVCQNGPQSSDWRGQLQFVPKCWIILNILHGSFLKSKVSHQIPATETEEQECYNVFHRTLENRTLHQTLAWT
jgi:hypothetical protein